MQSFVQTPIGALGSAVRLRVQSCTLRVEYTARTCVEFSPSSFTSSGTRGCTSEHICASNFRSRHGAGLRDSALVSLSLSLCLGHLYFFPFPSLVCCLACLFQQPGPNGRLDVLESEIAPPYNKDNISTTLLSDRIIVGFIRCL